MAFCTNCGSAVGDADRYCGKCGAAQPKAAPGPGTSGFGGPQFLSNVSSRTASLLCYIPWVGWIAAIVVLAAVRFRRDYEVRFHAFQGLYLFVIWLIVQWVITPLFWWMPMGPFGGHAVLPDVFRLAMIVVWVFMIVKVSQGENYRLPILGELAERSVTEQV